MAVYVVIRQPPVYRQLTFEDFLNNFQFFQQPQSVVSKRDITSTRTYITERVSDRVRSAVDTDALISVLEDYNRRTECFHAAERSDLYRHFCIPKRSGGLRPIDAPIDEFMAALRDLKEIFETNFGVLYHTSAFAYVKGRCAVDAVKRHQANESKWFGKFDFHNFFGSTTEDFVYRMFSMVPQFLR